MAKRHPIFHKLKAIVGYTIATVVIVIALGVSGLRLVLSSANVYQAEIEQLASTLLKQPVKIGKMDARLSGLIPTLTFHDVELLSKKSGKKHFSLAQADVGISFNDLVFKQKITPEQLTLKGLNLYVTRSVEGQLSIKGLDLAKVEKTDGADSSAFLEKWLLQQGEVSIEDSSFTWNDKQNAGLLWYFGDVNIILKKTQDRLQLLLSSDLPNVLGEKIKMAIDLTGDMAVPESWNVQSYLESKRLNIALLQKYISNKNIEVLKGVADLKLWLDWKNNQVQQLSGDIKLDKFTYRLNKKRAIALEHVSGIFDGYRNESNFWNVSVDKFDYESDQRVLTKNKFSVALRFDKDEIDSFYVSAKHLKLSAISKIILDNHFVSKKHQTHIKNLDAKGDIENLFVAWHNKALYQLKARFKDIGINAWGNVPNLKSITGDVRYEQQKGFASIASVNSGIGFPKLFRNDFDVDSLKAEIEFLKLDKGMLFDIHRVETKSPALNTVSKVKFWMPNDNSSPYMDLQTHLSKGDISKTSKYLPTGIMDGELVKWLDAALQGGKLNKGTVVFNGKFDDFPFKKNEGEFSVGIEASDFLFNFKDGWPSISKSNMTALFTGLGMQMNMSGGEAGKNQLGASSAVIKSFSNAEVELNLAAKGSSHNTMQFLTNSPILPEAKNTVEGMKFAGAVNTRVKINIPLGKAVRAEKQLSYSGTAELNDVSILMLNNKIDITKGYGTLLFSNESLSSENFTGNILGKPAKFVVSSTDKNITLAAESTMDAQQILSKFDIPGTKHITGITDITAKMNFPVNSDDNRHPQLTIVSDLSGIESKLPGKFEKIKETRKDFEFTTGFVGNERVQLGLEFRNEGSAILEIDQSKKDTFLRKGAISFSSNKAQLPRNNVLYLDGSIDSVNVQDWIKALDLENGKDKQSFFVKPIVFNLEELKLVTNKENESAVKQQSSPADFPRFEGIIKKFYLDNDFIGRLDFKVSRKKYSMHLDELIVSARNMKIVSSGDWNYWQGKHRTSMNFTLISNNFGGMLTDLGYAVVVDKGKAQAVGNVKWDGSPAEFSLGKINANIKLNLKEGVIKEVEAGAGRLLGLFSLSALPRRIFGDFKDAADKGFSFDTASGDLKIEKGNVYTEDFELDSPIANIFVSGRVGLVNKDYDNVIKVIPDVGSGVAGATALLVNLPAGIGLWLLDKMTGEQFDEASARIYDVTGSWDKPSIVQRQIKTAEDKRTAE